MIIEDAGTKIELEDIDAIERALDARLTHDYRDFLLQFNGGIPTPDTVDVPGAPGSPTDVQVFFGIGRSVESSDLLWNLSLVTDRCPERHLLPIACDSGGNLFCLKVDQGVASEVVYCDLESSDCALYTVAAGFGEFVKRLKPYGH